jgi:dTDP-4-amino-4,6-dideoxygalactose transaminase
VTERVAARVLTLPLWDAMRDSEVLQVAEAVHTVHRDAVDERLDA